MKVEFTIGKAIRTRGLDGELKFELYTSNPSRFSALKSAKLGNDIYEITRIKVEGDFAFVKFSGIDDATAAEKHRGELLSIKRSQLPPLPDGEHYVADLLGSDVFVDGDKLGELIDIQQYGSADVYVVRPLDGKGTVSFPALKDLFRSTDVEKGEIVLEGRLFRRVAIVNE